MSQVAKLFDELELRWTALSNARKDEVFSALPDISLTALSGSIAHLGVIIRALEARDLFTSSAELTTAGPPICKRLQSVSGLVNDAIANGLDWLAGTVFFEELSYLQATLAALTTKRISLARDIAKDLSKKGLPEIEKVIAAGEAAKVVIDANTKVGDVLASATQSASQVQAANEAIRSISTEAEGSSAEIKRLEGEAKLAAQAASEANLRAEGLSRTLAKLKEDAEARESSLEQRISEANSKVAALQTAAEQSVVELQKALRLARDQGLAQSFQSRSYTLRSERRLWTIVFVGAVLILATLSAIFVAEMPALTYQFLVVTLLRKLALAAPAIWLGWYSARQVGRVARVQEDYEYKAASALAYQSYKAEVAQVSDASLQTQLLKTAIETFGENPVRLYGDHASEPVTPFESGLKSLPPDKLIGLLTAALEAASRKKG